MLCGGVSEVREVVGWGLRGHSCGVGSQKMWGGASEVTEAVGWGMRGHRSCGVGCARSQAVGWGGQGHRSCGVGRARSQKLWGGACEVTSCGVGWTRSQKLWGGACEVTEAVGWGVRGHRSCGVGRGRSPEAPGVSACTWAGVRKNTGCVSLQSGNQKMGTSACTRVTRNSMSP